MKERSGSAVTPSLSSLDSYLKSTVLGTSNAEKWNIQKYGILKFWDMNEYWYNIMKYI